MDKSLADSFYLYLLALLLTGCAVTPTKDVDKTVTVNSQLCQSMEGFTLSVVGPYQVRIFEPNDLRSPDIWQGPVCVESETKMVNCGFRLSLIKSVTPSSDMKSIDIIVFSGSNSRTARITLATCEIKFLG